MDLRDYVAALRKRWYLIVLLAMLGGLVGVYKAESAPVQYKATSKVFVALSRGSTTQELVQGSTYAQNLVQSYAALASMPVVLDPVISELHLSMSTKSLSRAVSADTPLDTVIVEISAVTGDPQGAADISNAVARQLSTTVTGLSPSTNGGDTVRVELVAPASPPGFPIAPNKRMIVMTYFVVGLAAGVALALLRRILDTRVRTAEEIGQITDEAILGAIPALGRRQSRAITAVAPHSIESEAYRRLQTNLQFLDASSPVRAFVISSALGGEGKSATAINLAIAIAEKDMRVLLIDADMRRPSLATYCRLENSVGLTTVLIGRADLADVVQPWGPSGLDILTLGELPPNPSQLVGSPPMQELLARAQDEYDLVILDAPPLLPVADAAVLAKLTDGAVVVAGCHKVHRQQLIDAIATLDAVDARCLGIVANRVRVATRTSYYGYSSSPLTVWATRLFGSDDDKQRASVGKSSGASWTRTFVSRVSRAER